jgi:hypothetical protein
LPARVVKNRLIKSTKTITEGKLKKEIKLISTISY